MDHKDDNNVDGSGEKMRTTSTTTTKTMNDDILNQSSLDEVQMSIQRLMQDPKIRKQSQRAVQAHVWHYCTPVSTLLQRLRTVEYELVQKEIYPLISSLIYTLHPYTINVTLARAGIVHDDRIDPTSTLLDALNPEQDLDDDVDEAEREKEQPICVEDNDANSSSTTNKSNSQSRSYPWDLVCLDTKERLYMILQGYEGWLLDFFRLYPLHFYENSFNFIQRIPKKKLRVRVNVIGLGIGGSMAVSGLAKAGIHPVCGYEKRSEQGPSSVTSRYQNASWRAYEVASKLVDEQAYQILMESRQRIYVSSNNSKKGKESLPSATAHGKNNDVVVSTDRVQIILGSAIQAALESARRYGAHLHFNCDESAYYHRPGTDRDDTHTNDQEFATVTISNTQNGNEVCESTVRNQNSKGSQVVEPKYDLVALFCGAHTSELFPDLKEAMKIVQYPQLSSNCKMWLQMELNPIHEPGWCARGGEAGAEHWHYTIASARTSLADAHRILYNIDAQYQRQLQKYSSHLISDKDDCKQQEKDKLIFTYQHQRAQVEGIVKALLQQQSRMGDADPSVGPSLSTSDESTSTSTTTFDYIFTNAPDNPHNNAKQLAASNVVLDGGYTVEVKIATRSTIALCLNGDGNFDNARDDDKKNALLLRRFNTNLLVCGGDACVPPNPLAAYGATLACEAAASVVQLAIVIGHINSMILNFKPQKKVTGCIDPDLPALTLESIGQIVHQLEQLKLLLIKYHEVHAQSENYFQWVQTLICNMYSIGPVD